MERGSDYDLFLFGSPQASVDLSTFHPQPVEIFRLWQIYLDNVNPLLKVIHVPTMQGRIIEAVGNVHGISPPMESLMFSIYCIAITSLSNDECQSMLGMSQTDLLTKYQFGCQQALMNARFLVSRERDTLISLYLFLVGQPLSCLMLRCLTGTAAISSPRDASAITQRNVLHCHTNCQSSQTPQRTATGEMFGFRVRDATKTLVVACT